MSEQVEFYFKNRVTLMGKVVDVANSNDDFQTVILETKEIWPDSASKVERHEIRWYRTKLKPELVATELVNRFVEITGRIRLKEVARKDGIHSEYRPYIHGLDLSAVAA